MMAKQSPPSLLFLILLSLSVLLLHAGCVRGGVFEYAEKELLRGEENNFYLRMALARKGDVFPGTRGSGFSIEQNITQIAPDGERPTGTVDIIIFHSSQYDDVGVQNGIARTFCCTDEILKRMKTDKKFGDELKKRGAVCEKGDVIVSKSLLKGDQRHVLSFDEDTPVVEFRIEMDTLRSSGVYYVLYVNCEDNSAGTVVVDGQTTWINPFGHLPADEYWKMWFFLVMTIVYICLGIFWIVKSALHWRKLLMLQNLIALIIFLGMIENAAWYEDLSHYNEKGSFNWAAVTVCILSSALKRTLSRVLVLIVSMGCGVVKADLGEARYKVTFLAVLYFATSAMQQLIGVALREGQTGESLTRFSELIVFPVALFDCVFFWWIIFSLVKTVQQLQARRQMVKLAMYKAFFRVLLGVLLATVMVVLLQMAILYTSTRDANFRTWWMYDAFWHVLYFTVLLAVAIIWRPTSNNTRYSYVSTKESSVEMEDIPVDTDLVSKRSVGKGEGYDEEITIEEPVMSSKEISITTLNLEGMDGDLLRQESAKIE